MRIGVAATQICGMIGFCRGKTRIRAFEPFQAVTQAMLATLMLGIQRFQLAQIGSKLHLHEYERMPDASAFISAALTASLWTSSITRCNKSPLAELLHSIRLVRDGILARKAR